MSWDFKGPKKDVELFIVVAFCFFFYPAWQRRTYMRFSLSHFGNFLNESYKNHRYVWLCIAPNENLILLTMNHSFGRNCSKVVQSFVRSQSEMLHTHRKLGVSTASDSSFVTVTLMTQSQTARQERSAEFTGFKAMEGVSEVETLAAVVRNGI